MSPAKCLMKSISGLGISDGMQKIGLLCLQCGAYIRGLRTRPALIAENFKQFYLC